jgi:hypothetical protein
MRGTFFIKPLEIILETAGETWLQGAGIKGSVSIKSHGTFSPCEFDLLLAYGEIKKVHQKSVKWEILESKKLNINDNNFNVNFEFKLDINAPITDKKNSLFLVIQKGAEYHHLQLNITPFPLIIKIKELFETFNSFKTKEMKSTKGNVEIKFDPPENKEWAYLDSIIIMLNFDGDKLNWKSDLNLNKLDISGVTNKVKKEKKSVKLTLTPKDYYLAGTMPHQENLLKTIKSIIQSETKRLT